MPPIVPSMPWPGAVTMPGSLPGHGGCTFLADPAEDPLISPAYWSAESSPFVLPIDSPEAVFRIRGTILQRDIAIGEVRYLVLRANFGAHRIQLTAEARLRVPSITLGLDASLLTRLGCLAALASGKPDVPLRLRPTPCQAARLGLMLAVLDRLEDDANGAANLRAIARELAFPGVDLPARAIEWKSSSIRRQTQRLVATAKRLRDVGYRHLLQGRVRAGPIFKRTSVAREDTSD